MATSVSNISVSFRLFKESEVRSISVVDIQNASTFDHGVPKPHGLQDAHMGTTDRSIMCQTCHLAHCAGHFGMIELPKRVYYAGHVKRIMLLLRTMCTICIRPLLGEDIARKISASAKGFDKLKIVSDTSRKLSVCPHCKFALPSITDTNKLFIQRQWSDTDYEKMPAEAQTFLTTRFSADDAYTIIDAMPDSWLGILGFTISSSHPRDAIPRCILVLPPAQRPTLRIADGGKGRGEDDMTMLYQEVVRAKLDLETKLLSKTATEIDKFNSFAKMQLCVACLIKSSYKKSVEIKGMLDHGAGRGKVRTLRDMEHRLKGKGGRLRGTLNAKRTDFSARTVVGIDMNYDIWRLGVPETRMKVLTFPEKVNRFNIDVLRERIRRGATADHGAVNVIHSSSISTMEPKNTYLGLMDQNARFLLAESLEVGWIVERHLQDGDWVLFNRQPTLHKMNMQAFQIYGIPGLTFRLPLPATRPFNADYDGDEMNMHVPQSIEAIAEAQELMAVPHNMISPSNTAAIIAPVQETLVAWYRLTSKNTLLTKDKMCQLQTQIQYDPDSDEYADMPTLQCGIGPIHLSIPAIIKSPKGQRWTGKQVASVLLKKNINILKAVRDGDLKEESSWIGYKEDVVCIQKGELLLGRLCKATLGGGQSLTHNIWKDIGSWASAKFVSDIQRVGNLWNQMDGTCIGIRDCMVDEETDRKIDQMVCSAMEKADFVESTSFQPEIKEIRTSGVLQDILRAAGAEVLKSMDHESALSQVVVSGSKGNALNLSQIMAVVGQQSLGGRRVLPRKTRIGMRGLICFPPNDRRPEALGFVATSYIQGQTEDEYFHAMMAGREGIVATAVETATSGYNQRKMVKIQEGQVVAYDKTVRVADQSIVAIHYGADDLDSTKLERVRISSLRMSDDAMYQWCGDKDELKILIAARDCLRMFCTPAIPGELKPVLSLPFQPERIQDTIIRSKVPISTITRLEYKEWLNKLLFDILALYNDTEYDSVVDMFQKQRLKTDKPWLKVMCAILLTWPFVVITESKFDMEQINMLKNILISKIKNAMITPGEAVGTIGATSIGEPSTQGALNVFHFSGIAEKNAMAGLPRFKQLINAAKCSDTCNISFILPEDATNAESITKRLKAVWLKYLIKNNKVIKTSAPSVLRKREETVWPFVTEWMSPLLSKKNDTLKLITSKIAPTSDTDEWVVELYLDKNKCLSESVVPSEIANRLIDIFSDTALVIYTETYELDWIIRIRPCAFDIWGPTFQSRSVCEALLDTITAKCLIRGIAGIHDSYMIKHTHDEAISNGGLQRKNKMKIGTLGSDLISTAWLLNNSLHTQQLFTNDVIETSQVLGIESAALLQNEELLRVLCFDSTYVDARHTMLLAETMTRCGSIAALNRHKMEELGSSLLQRASFEQTLPVLEDAAFFNRSDPLTGSLERQIVGLPLRVGTGLVGIVEQPLEEEEHVVLAPIQKSEKMFIPKLNIIKEDGHQLYIAPIRRDEWTPHADFDIIPKLQGIVDRVSISSKMYEDAVLRGEKVTLRGQLIPIKQAAFDMMLTRIRGYCGWDAASDDWQQSTKVEWDGATSIITHGKQQERTHYKSSSLVSTRIAWPMDTYTFEVKARKKEYLNLKHLPASIEPRQTTIRQRQIFNKDGWQYIFCKSWTNTTILKTEADLLTIPPKLSIIIETLDIANRLQKLDTPEKVLVGKWWQLTY